MIENIASLCVGGIVGYFAMFFITRFSSYTPKVLGSLISVILGGGAVGFLGKLSNMKEVYSYYAIGLACGVVVGIVFYWIKHHKPPILKT